MTTDVLKTSAKIYQFPIGGRRSLGGQREQVKPEAEVRLPQAAAIAVGGASYHDAAIQDSKRAGER